MLGARTKQVFSYGRRSHRVVNAYDDYTHKPKDLDSLHVKRENDVPPSRLAEKVLKHSPVSVKSATAHNVSPLRVKKTKKSPKVAKVSNVGAAKPLRRHILGSIAPNAPASPAVPPSTRAKRRQTVAKTCPLTPHSPIVSVDIVVLDAQGRRVSQEHRISRTDVQPNVFAAGTLKKTKAPPRSSLCKKKSDAIVVTSDSEDPAPLLRPKRNVRRKANPIIISDDEDSGSDYALKENVVDADTSTEEVTFRIPRLKRGVRARSNVILSPSPTPSLSSSSSPATSPVTPSPVRQKPAKPSAVAASTIPVVRNATLPAQSARPPTLAPFSSLPNLDQEAGPSRSKPRKLTPIRARPGRAIFPVPPSPPSPTTLSEFDLDVTFDFAQLALSPRALAEVQQLDRLAAPSAPAYVQPLLDECAQTTPHEFSAFIDMFPLDPIVRLHDPEGRVVGSSGPPKFQKIGEASFSEVFGIGDVVLKIIPLCNEDRAAAAATMDVEGPAPSEAKDVLKEIIVTRAMGDSCPGFVELLRAYVVRGKYPSLLLDLWDEYEERKGSESVRPDTFTVSQLYAIIVLPNGGPDLEAYTFDTPTKTGWQQACSVFWQVARTLAEAEESVNFEHRDLHWGQILVKNVPTKITTRRKTRMSMDDPDHGVLVTIIDLGFARMDSHDRGSSRSRVHWTPFDEEVFEGEGDYQFDVYRMMRTSNGDEWEAFHPVTNVMWLHYLVLKLLYSKRLRPPTVAKKTTAAVQPAAGFSERECYECLKEMEVVLSQCLIPAKAPQTARRGRRKTQAPAKVGKDVVGPKSAGEVLAIATAKGWIP